MYLRLSQIYNFVKGDVNCRNICEGEEVLKSGQIVTVGCSKATKNEKEIMALVLQTSSLSSFPHTVVGTFSINDDSLSITTMTCSCKAGLSGACKHVVAVLLFIERNDVNQLEDLSCTDLKCAWAARKTSQTNFTPSQTKQLCCVKTPVKVPINEDLNFETLFEEVLGINENSAMYLSAQGRNTKDRSAVQANQSYSDESLKYVIEDVLNNDILQKYERFFSVTELSAGCCLNVLQNLAVLHPLIICRETEKYRDAWDRERQFRVSGTRIYGLFTYARNKNPNWKEKAQNYFWPKTFLRTAPIRHGLHHEKYARETYEREYNCQVIQTGFIVHPGLCWVGFSPDGIVPGVNGLEKLIEIKCVYEGKNKNINECLDACAFLQKDYTLKKIHTYYGQVQLGMLLLNLKKCDFIVYASVDKSIYVTEVIFDETFAINMVLNVQKVFLEKMLHFICLHNSESQQDQDLE